MTPESAQSVGGKTLWLTLIAIGLAAASLWPLSVSVQWYRANEIALSALGRVSSLRGYHEPSIVLLLPPSLAIAASIAGPVVSFFAIRSARHAMIAFSAGAAIQLVVAAVIALTRETIDTSLARILSEWGRGAVSLWLNPAVFLQGHGAMVNGLLPMLVGIGLAYGVAAVLLEHVPSSDLVTTFDPRGAATTECYRDQPRQPLSVEGARFTRDEYEVRLTFRRWFPPWRKDAEYEIRAQEDEQDRFSYSTTTGRLTDCNGAVVLTLVEDREALRRRLTVYTAGGQRLGVLVSLPNGWSIRDGLGRPLAEIHREAMGMHHAIYSARVESLENCQYVWRLAAGNRYVLTLTFGPGRQLDRALAVAVAPYIEDDAYWRTERRRERFYS